MNKIIVVFKWMKNPEDFRLNSDGSVDWDGIKMSPTDDDPQAMDIACSIADGREVIGLTIGDGDINWAAARGADRTVVVTDAKTNVNSSVTGEILAAAIRRMNDVGVVLIGDSAWDYGVISALAGHLKWPAMFGVETVTKDGEDLIVTRKKDNVIQTFSVKEPILLAVSATRGEQNFPSMREVIAARKKPVEELTVSKLGLQIKSNVKTIGTRVPEASPAKIFADQDPFTSSNQLVAALRDEGML